MLDQLMIVKEFWRIDECARLRASMDQGRASCAEIYAGGYRIDEDVRRAFEIDVDDGTIDEVRRAIEGVRSRVSRFFEMSLAADEGPGFLRYTTGGHYRLHRDVAADWDADFPRRISLVVFLTTAGGAGAGRCEGGSLRLLGAENDQADPAPLDIPPAAGTLVAFPSTLLHEVLPVTAGVRDAIVDWFY